MTAPSGGDQRAPTRTITPATLARAIAELEGRYARRLAAAEAAGKAPRRFTLKHIANPHRAEARARRDTLDPFPDGDLKAAGIAFVDLPVVEVSVAGVEQWRVARREGDVEVERLGLAANWVARQAT